jgi:hypothetical protein
MRRLLIAILACVALCGYCLAQDAAPQASPAPTQSQQVPATPQPAAPGSASVTPRIAPGSVIPVQLTKTVDAKKAKTGDEVEARVTQDMKAVNGQTLLTKDTKVVGHIVEDQPRTKDQNESHIAIAFDRVVAKNGGDTPLPMSIQAIISPAALGGGNSGNGSGDNASSMPNPGGMPPSSSGGRAGMGGGTPPPTANPSGTNYPTGSQGKASTHEPITGNTQGVVGISDLKLSTSDNGAQGSVVSSDKNNVKLESGTLMLLRVSQ